jgi:hypothetical protein
MLESLSLRMDIRYHVHGLNPSRYDQNLHACLTEANVLQELENFVSTDLRAREVDDRTLEPIKCGKYILTMQSPLQTAIPIVKRKKIVVFGDSIIELSNYDPLHGLDCWLTRGK